MILADLICLIAGVALGVISVMYGSIEIAIMGAVCFAAGIMAGWDRE